MVLVLVPHLLRAELSRKRSVLRCVGSRDLLGWVDVLGETLFHLEVVVRVETVRIWFATEQGKRRVVGRLLLFYMCVDSSKNAS